MLLPITACLTTKKEKQLKYNVASYLSLLPEDDPCSAMPLSMNKGPHHAKAPATNDTHVNPAVDNIKLLLKRNEITLKNNIT